MTNVVVRIDYHHGAGSKFVGMTGYLVGLGDDYARVQVGENTSVVCKPHWVSVIERGVDEYPLVRATQHG